MIYGMGDEHNVGNDSDSEDNIDEHNSEDNIDEHDGGRAQA